MSILNRNDHVILNRTIGRHDDEALGIGQKSSKQQYKRPEKLEFGLGQILLDNFDITKQYRCVHLL